MRCLAVCLGQVIGTGYEPLTVAEGQVRSIRSRVIDAMPPALRADAVIMVRYIDRVMMEPTLRLVGISAHARHCVRHAIWASTHVWERAWGREYMRNPATLPYGFRHAIVGSALVEMMMTAAPD
jgi:hypothetical protein